MLYNRYQQIETSNNSNSEGRAMFQLTLPMLGYVAITIGIYYVAMLALIVILGNIGGDILFRPDREILEGKARCKEILWAIIAAPLWEEAMFRGPVYFVMEAMGKSSWITYTTLIATSAIFGVMHLFGFSFIPPTVKLLRGNSINNNGRVFRVCFCSSFGAASGLLVILTGSMMPSLILHSVANLIATSANCALTKTQPIPPHKETL